MVELSNEVCGALDGFCKSDLPPRTFPDFDVEFTQPFEGADRCERAALQRRKLSTARQRIAQQYPERGNDKGAGGWDANGRGASQS